MQLSDTSANRRTGIRHAVRDLVREAVDFLPNSAVFAARAEAEKLEDFVSIYFEDIEREREQNRAQAYAPLVIRVSSKVPADVADERLDEISAHIERAMCERGDLGGLVWDSFLERVSYSVSKSGVYSSVELVYALKYDD